MIRTILLTILLAASGSAQIEPFAAVARNTFLDLLKLPAEHPQVQVLSHGTRTEDGLRIEDISWTSLDGEVVPAYIVMPENPSGRLPAIVCLHGSSGSRESMVTKEFGPVSGRAMDARRRTHGCSAGRVSSPAGATWRSP